MVTARKRALHCPVEQGWEVSDMGEIEIEISEMDHIMREIRSMEEGDITEKESRGEVKMKVKEKFSAWAD
jgi:hypothetical protein